MNDDFLPGNRRAFLKTGSLAAAASSVPLTLRAQDGGDELRVALVGCGGRGTGAASQSLNVEGTRLVAMADAFPDKVDSAHDRLKAQHGDRVDVPAERRFAGFDAYQKAIDAADVVLLCTPPGFRPPHFEYAVKQGRHIFAEKPLAVDGPGIRKVLEAAKEADRKNLKIVCGLQRRYQSSYLATLEKINEGAIGDFVSSQVYWNSGGVWVRNRKPDMSEMEYQMRNWYYFNWICGDHIVEQHIHNIDVSNWFKGAHPTKAVGMGGRSQRIGPEFGEIFDHHYVEFTYPDGTVMNSQCRHWRNTWSRVTETIAGSEGSAYPGMLKDRDGKIIWRFRDAENQPYQEEHHVLYDAIRNDTARNDTYHTAEATLTAILGRMATYSGDEVSWEDALNSELSTMPDKLAWDADPGPKPGPDGLYPCPVPGEGTYY